MDAKHDISVQGDFWLDCTLLVHEPIRSLELRVGIYGSNSLNVCAFATGLTGANLQSVAPGTYRLRLTVDELPLNGGPYTLNASLSDAARSDEIIDAIEDALAFTVLGGDPFGTGRLPTAGAVVLTHHWELSRGEPVAPQRAECGGVTCG